MKKKWEALLLEYGTVAAVVWFSIFGVVFFGFLTAIKLGFRPESVTSEAGVWGAAYLATQVTKPVRIAATLVLTPFAAKVLRRTPRARPADAATTSARDAAE